MCVQVHTHAHTSTGTHTMKSSDRRSLTICQLNIKKSVNVIKLTNYRTVVLTDEQNYVIEFNSQIGFLKTSGKLGIKGNFLNTTKAQANISLSFEMVAVNIKEKYPAYHLLCTNKDPWRISSGTRKPATEHSREPRETPETWGPGGGQGCPVRQVGDEGHSTDGTSTPVHLTKMHILSLLFITSQSKFKVGHKLKFEKHEIISNIT